MIEKFNNVSFKGAFYVKTPTKQVKEQMNAVAGKRKVIYENINDNNDNLYVVRPSADKRVLNYLIANNAKFTYYPTLSTSDNFYPEKITQALEKLKNAEFKTDENVKDEIKNQNAYFRYNGIIPHHCVYIMGFLDKNSIEIKSLKKYANGESVVVGPDDKVKATFSPIGKYGFSFVTVNSKNADDSAKFYAINEHGDIFMEYKSLDGIKKFKKLYKGAIEHFVQNKKQNHVVEEQPALSEA